MLIGTLTGTDSLDPYNNVSFRVLQRMADLLMNRTDLDVIDPFNSRGGVINALKQHYLKKLKDRKKFERSFWEDPIEGFHEKLQKN